MKVYYIFKIKNEFVSLYKDSPSVLYQILKSIYYLDKQSVDIGYNLFNQLIQTIDKIELDRDIYVKMHKDIPYIKQKDIHIINNLYKNEVSRLRINHFFMRLELDQDFCSFYPYLNKKEKHLFVCNFKVCDFFFLDDYLKISLPKTLAYPK